MKPRLLLVLCLMQIFITAGFSQAISRASYGENCSREIRCESRSFLTCSNGQCDCMMPDTMVFDESIQKCVTLAGERCQYNSFEGENTWTEEVPCVLKAVCRNGVCDCEPNFYEISNGTCLLKREFGAECFSNEMCSSAKHLVCGGDQTCVCGPNRVLSGDKCVLLAGSACTPDADCIQNSECVGATGESQTCVCSKHYFQAENKTCQRKKTLNDYCANNLECLETVSYPVSNSYGHPYVDTPTFLVCEQGKCQCNSSLADVDYYSDIRICGKKAGQQCTERECITGASCSGTCQCQTSSYFETENRTCEAKRVNDQPCVRNEQCAETLECDMTTRSCICKQGTAFHPQLKKCALSPGFTCRASNRDRENSRHSYYFSTQEDIKTCAPSAVCKDPAPGNRYDSNSWTCKCIEGTKIHRGSCYAQESKPCNGDTLGTLTTKTCLPGLACQDGSCTCLYKDHQVYQESLRKCSTLVGGPCNATSDCFDGNAECHNVKGMNQCVCKKGFTEADRKCDIAYGGTCEQGKDDPRCDRYGPLVCSVREICECSDFQVYDQGILKCKGLVGAKCNLKSDGEDAEDFCVEGATCEPFRGFKTTVGLCACQSGWETGLNRTCTATMLADSPFKLDGNILLPESNEIA